MEQKCRNFTLLIAMVVLTVCANVMVKAQQCEPSGKLRGKKGNCNRGDNSDCCKEGQLYPIYKCSPPVTTRTSATLSINSFARGGEGGGPSECDGQYHNDDTLVVALSTGWFSNKKRCNQEIIISGNGKSVKAKVVDECDSTAGCDNEHGFQPPCANNIVDASKAVWKGLGLNENDRRWGQMDVTWSDA